MKEPVKSNFYAKFGIIVKVNAVVTLSMTLVYYIHVGNT